MKKTISLLLVVLLLTGISAAAFADNSPSFFGTVDGQTYCNEFFNLRFEAAADWVLFDSETAVDEIHYTKAALSTEEDLFRQLLEAGVVFDLFARKADTGDISLVQLSIMDLKTMFGMVPDMEYLLDMLAKQTEQPLVDVYESVDVTKGEMLFAGEKRPSFSLVASVSGITLYEQAVLIRRENYLVMVAAASVQEGVAEDLLARFRPAFEEETASVLNKARFLVNRGEGLEAMKQLLVAAKASDDPAIETAIRHLENSQWKKVSQTVYSNTGGDILNSTSYVYNDAGICSEVENYAADGKLSYKQVYRFDSNGFPCGVTSYDPDGSVRSEVVVVCDELGNMIRQEGSATYQYFYNLYGDNTLIIRTEADGEEFSRTFYTYDEYGIWAGMTNLIDGRSIVQQFDSEYEFLDGGETLRIVCRHSGTDRIASEYELKYIPLK